MATAAEMREQAAKMAERESAARSERGRLAKEARRLEREERQAKERAENDAHYERMRAEIGEPLAGLNANQHAAVYAMAWEHGHASGYSDVESYYSDFAELARKILDAR